MEDQKHQNWKKCKLLHKFKKVEAESKMVELEYTKMAETNSPECEDWFEALLKKTNITWKFANHFIL